MLNRALNDIVSSNKKTFHVTTGETQESVRSAAERPFDGLSVPFRLSRWAIPNKEERYKEINQRKMEQTKFERDF